MHEAVEHGCHRGGRHALSSLDPPAATSIPQLAAEPDCKSAPLNYYKHHIGDYAKKTVHLSPLEHGVYLLMLHAYYGTEKPLPAGESLYRIAHAHSRVERAAVDSVAAQFWTKTDTGLVNGRAFEEIETATQLVNVARQNGNRGGRPKRTQRVTENNPVGSESETQRVLKKKAIQTPDSIPDSEDQGSSAKGAHPPDPRKQLFELGKTILGANAGGLISKAISASDEATVGAILGEMAIKPTADPRAYFTAAARRKGEGERFKTA